MILTVLQNENGTEFDNKFWSSPYYLGFGGLFFATLARFVGANPFPPIPPITMLVGASQGGMRFHNIVIGRTGENFCAENMHFQGTEMCPKTQIVGDDQKLHFWPSGQRRGGAPPHRY